MHIHLLVNLFRTDAAQAALDTVALFKDRNVQVSGEPDTAEELGIDAVPIESFGDADLVLAIGGDGTLIRASHLIAGRKTPIMGVHYGRFGFVTQVKAPQLKETLNMFLEGQCNIENRMMVRTELVRGNETIATLHSINEAVVQRSATSKMLTFEVQVDGAEVSRYPADGVMVATPTGSTAYNLSAGGPVVDPRMDALVLTAIMPHTLSARSLVLRASSQIEIKVESREDAILSCDSHSRLHVLSGDFVRITQSERRTKLVSVNEHDFFDKLSDRLQWSQGSI